MGFIKKNYLKEYLKKNILKEYLKNILLWSLFIETLKYYLKVKLPFIHILIYLFIHILIIIIHKKFNLRNIF